jgi:prepilin-type N-terminal cleavage/methylation domain-containing protein
MTGRLRNQDGFTLVEVLTAMVVGLVVLAAAFDLVSRSTMLATTTQDRVDASQRGRSAIEDIVTELRSGVCVTPDAGDPQPPIIRGESDRVEFYANTGADSLAPQRRVLTYDPDKHTIVEQTFNGEWTDPAQPGKVKVPFVTNPTSRTLLTNVYPRDSGAPIFRYYGYQVTQTGFGDPPVYEVIANASAADGSVPAAQLRVPIQARDDLFDVIAVAVAFRVRPANVKSSTNDPRDAVLTGTAFARTADPTLAVDPEKVSPLTLPDGTQTNVGPGVQCS